VRKPREAGAAASLQSPPRLAAGVHASLSLPPCRTIAAPLWPADAGSSSSICSVEGGFGERVW